MSLRADHKALVFVGAVAVLGAGVRVLRAASGSTAQPSAQAALDRQMAAADSSATSARLGEQRGVRTRGRKNSGSRRTLTTSNSADTSAMIDPSQGTPSRRRAAGPLDRRGYVGGRLDLDVATAAQIDSLPGITPTIARRIASDRVKRGPFLSLDGLRRVTGIGPTLIKRLDTLVMFSGAFVQAMPEDTTIPVRRAKGRTRAPARRRAPPPEPP